ncbi:MAG TPA: hypothetical protein VEL75_07290 [Candidatus Methylomirabilis sp.]|nr:hypothetical protein [Candidatus Methylomirabilis sp.]
MIRLQSLDHAGVDVRDLDRAEPSCSSRDPGGNLLELAGHRPPR